MNITPCPYCGESTDFSTGFDTIGRPWLCWINCDRCGAQGPRAAFTRESEINAAAEREWNRREAIQRIPEE